MTFRIDNVIVSVERDADLTALFTAATEAERKAIIARLPVLATVDGSEISTPKGAAA